MKLKTIKTAVIYLFLFFAGGNITLAQTLYNPIGANSISGVINNIIVALRDQIAPPLVVVMVLIGGLQMLFSVGDPDKFKKGKKTVIYAVVAYAIIIIASGVTSIIQDILA